MQRATPFTRIAADNSDFLDDEYIPRNFTIKSPRSMKQDQLLSFFRHISAREQTYGIKNAFRFKSVLSGRKKGFLLPAQYGAGAGAAGSSFLAPTSQNGTQPETVEPGALGPTLAAVGLASLEPAGAGAGGSFLVATTSQQKTQPETVEPGPATSGPATLGLAPLDLAGAGAGAGGPPLVVTTTQPEAVHPLKSGRVRRSRVVPRLAGPVKLGPATVDPAPASSSRLQTSDLLALEEAKRWEVSGKRRRR